jgi:hypothetical protein
VTVKEAAEPVRTARRNPNDGFLGRSARDAAGATASLTWRSRKRRSRKEIDVHEPQRLADLHKKDILAEEEFRVEEDGAPGPHLSG